MKREITQYPANYPEEYITGTVIFYGREFTVTPDVLIPRLETESLVRYARRCIQDSKTPIFQHTTIIDIGCGSGIIGISVADLADEVIFLDISESALGVAENNFGKHHPDKKAQFILSDLLSGVPSSIYNLESKIYILANLPYIKGDDWINMSPDTRYEPELALFGGEATGFEMYERLFEQLGVMSYELGETEMTLIIEFGFDQREIAERTIQKYGWRYHFFPDHAGMERFCEIIIDKNK